MAPPNNLMQSNNLVGSTKCLFKIRYFHDICAVSKFFDKSCSSMWYKLDAFLVVGKMKYSVPAKTKNRRWAIINPWGYATAKSPIGSNRQTMSGGLRMQKTSITLKISKIVVKRIEAGKRGSSSSLMSVNSRAVIEELETTVMLRVVNRTIKIWLTNWRNWRKLTKKKKVKENYVETDNANIRFEWIANSNRKNVSWRSGITSQEGWSRRVIPEW